MLFHLLFWFKNKLLQNSICCQASNSKAYKNDNTIGCPLNKCQWLLRDIVRRSIIKRILYSRYVFLSLQRFDKLRPYKFKCYVHQKYQEKIAIAISRTEQDAVIEEVDTAILMFQYTYSYGILESQAGRWN